MRQIPLKESFYLFHIYPQANREMSEFKVEFSTQGLTFERWVKVMIASTKSAYQKEKAGEGGGGVFSSFGK